MHVTKLTLNVARDISQLFLQKRKQTEFSLIRFDHGKKNYVANFLLDALVILMTMMSTASISISLKRWRDKILP